MKRNCSERRAPSTFNNGMETIVERITKDFLTATPSANENISSKRGRKPTLKAAGILTFAVGNDSRKREGALQ